MATDGHDCRCHKKKIGTPIFRHTRATNPRIFGTPIPIFLGLRDPTRDLHPENWNEILPFVFVPRIHFGKAEAAYRHPELASYCSTWCSYPLESYILPNVSPCYYLRVQLTYLDELYEECSGTARACANSGYRVLLPYFFRAPENEARW